MGVMQNSPGNTSGCISEYELLLSADTLSVKLLYILFLNTLISKMDVSFVQGASSSELSLSSICVTNSWGKKHTNWYFLTDVCKFCLSTLNIK